MAQGRARYGVGTNPFAPGGSLDPSQGHQAAKALVLVDGFRKLTEIRQKMEIGRQRNLPLFVLVSGPAGAGRSSMEYAVLDLWREISRVETSRFARVHAKAKTDSEVDLVRDWLADLVLRLTQLEGLPVDERRIEELESAVGLPDLSQMRLKVKKALPRISTEMSKAKPTPFEIGASFTEVRSRMVEGVCSIFEGLPKLCILTFSEKDPPDPDLRIETECHRVHTELGPLSREDLGTLIEARWGAGRIPFSVEAVQDYYTPRKQHVGLVLSRLYQLFERMCAAHADHGGIWPADEALFYGPDRVRATLEQIETGI
jgi:hypothetical protein